MVVMKILVMQPQQAEYALTLTYCVCFVAHCTYGSAHEQCVDNMYILLVICAERTTSADAGQKCKQASIALTVKILQKV